MKLVVAVLLLACVAFAANVSIEAPVKSAVLYSNGFCYSVREGAVQAPSGESLFKIENFTKSAFFSSVSASASSGAIAEIYQYLEEWNETTSEKALLSFEKLLNMSLNSEITFITGNSTKAGKLVWFDERNIGVVSGGVFSIYPTSQLAKLDSPIGEFSEDVEKNESKRESGLAIRVVNASAGEHKLRLGYLSSGSSWSPNYKFYLQEESQKGIGTLHGWAEVSNSGGEDWDRISLTLVVGYPRISRQQYVNYDYAYKQAYSEEFAMGAAPNVEPSFTSAPFSSYIYYSLASPATIKSGESRQLPLFTRQQEYEREYFWDTSRQSPEKVFILNNTGSAARAAGIVSVYLNGEFLGEAPVAHTPLNQQMRVAVSDLPDIHVKKEEINQTSTEEYRSTTIRYKQRLAVTNAIGEKLTLRINDQMRYGAEVRFISSSAPALQKPNRILEWNVTVESGETALIDYEYDVTSTRYY